MCVCLRRCVRQSTGMERLPVRTPDCLGGLTFPIAFARLATAAVQHPAGPSLCRSGGIGRRAWFRSMYSQGCGGSSPFFGTSYHGSDSFLTRDSVPSSLMRRAFFLPVLCSMHRLYYRADQRESGARLAIHSTTPTQPHHSAEDGTPIAASVSCSSAADCQKIEWPPREAAIVTSSLLTSGRPSFCGCMQWPNHCRYSRHPAGS
jgi:hypothetical protein